MIDIRSKQLTELLQETTYKKTITLHSRTNSSP